MIDRGIISEEDCNVIHYVNWVYRLKGKGNTVEKVESETEPTKTCYFLKEEYLENIFGIWLGQGYRAKGLGTGSPGSFRNQETNESRKGRGQIQGLGWLTARV